MNYDLEDRTALFAGNVINLCKQIKRNDINRSIIIQLIKSATSVGVNYMEANGAASKKDFTNKIRISLKEARETKYWLRILGNTEKQYIHDCRVLWKEAHEFCLMFGKIANS